jgi:hypothetical protein
MDQAYAGFARATKRADASVGYCLATAVHIADYARRCQCQFGSGSASLCADAGAARPHMTAARPCNSSDLTPWRLVLTPRLDDL